jgi:ParB-like chromosome segregation protein Spo0J
VLDRLQIPWTFEPAFLLTEVVMPVEGTQIRANAAPRATVDEYAVAYENGAEFPPFVLHRTTKKLVDGNTRFAAASKAGVQNHPVYLAEVRLPRLAMIVQGALNQLNGERLNNEQAVETARLMHEQGYNAEEIAYSTGRKISTIVEAIKVIELEKRADTLGLPIEKLSKAVKVELSGIQLDEPLRLITQAVAEKGVGREDARDVKNRLAAAHSESEAIAIATEQVHAWDAKTVPPKQKIQKEKGAPVRRLAENLLVKIRELRWNDLADADHQATRATLDSLCSAISELPGR